MIIGLIVLLPLASAAVAVLMMGRDSGGGGPTATDVTAPAEPPSTTTESTTSATTPTTRATSGDDYAGGEWVEMTVATPPGDAYFVAVSDNAAIFQKEGALFALEFASNRLQKIPTQLETVGSADIDGDQLVWWEGTYSATVEEWAEQAVFAYRLPSGPRVELVGTEHSPGFPLVAGSRLTWTQARPSTYAPDEIWEFPIYGIRVNPTGRPKGKAELLVPAPTGFVLGDSTWIYDLSPTHLAWENHDERSGAAYGSYVRDLRSGEETYLGLDAWRPSVAGAHVAYWDGDGLYLRDLETDEVRLLDAEGDWPALAESYVTYLRPSTRTDTSAWDIVTLGLADGSEQVVGQQTTPPWFGSAISVATRHMAYVDDDGQPHIFERRSR
ncbi:MAG: hypothetical protein KKA32_02350 [Actinobacteria bacterium]|nr:hypothetical protein [Actinomycetota bacterium]